MNNSNGGPAFPQNFVYDPEKGMRCSDEDGWVRNGMTLRDYFAGQALVGLVSDGMFTPAGYAIGSAKLAYEIADAMLKERGAV